MAKKYQVVKGIVSKGGKAYRMGDVIELEDKNVKLLGDRVRAYKVTPKTDVSELKQTNVSPAELTMDELKQIAERDGLEVVGSGKGGAVTKKDYVKAIEEK